MKLIMIKLVNPTVGCSALAFVSYHGSVVIPNTHPVKIKATYS